jgi:effector-binding domain-containing protein
MSYDIRIEQQTGIPLAVVRRRAQRHEFSKVVPEACGLVWNELKSRKVTGAGRHVAIYFDDQVNLEIGVELETPLSGDGEVVASTTPAGAIATTTHFGPYGGLGQAHEAIQRWCRANGYALAGPCWELYGHWLPEWNQNASLIRTDVFYLLAPSRGAP